MTTDRKITIGFLAVLCLLAGLSYYENPPKQDAVQRLDEIKREIDLLQKEAVQIMISVLEENREAEERECYQQMIDHGVKVKRGLASASQTSTVCEEITRLVHPETRCSTRLSIVGWPAVGVWKLQGPHGDHAWIPERLQTIFSVMADDAADTSAQGRRFVGFRLNELLRSRGVCP